MTLGDILNEVNIEIGNGKALVYGARSLTHKTQDKSGAMDETRTKLMDANKVLSKPSKIVINKILAYLKKKNLFPKISKLDLESADIVMKADGGATINFDDGGTVNIPVEVLRNFNY